MEIKIEELKVLFSEEQLQTRIKELAEFFPDLADHLLNIESLQATLNANNYEKEGYTFVGWYRGEPTNIVTEFTMPDRDVVLKGYFKPDTGTQYKVEQYFFQSFLAIHMLSLYINRYKKTSFS